MSGDQHSWAGARWWKVDLHTHTPASSDYGRGPNQQLYKQHTPRAWLLDYMRAGIDCVAVTDHNSGAWIDPLKAALRELEQEQPEGYRPLVLLPGVELSVHSSVHLLAILPESTSTADIHMLLGAVHYPGTRGASDGVTEHAFTEVASEIHRAGGLAIPAHVDGPRGLWAALNGETLKQALRHEKIIAMERADLTSPVPAAYLEQKCAWTAVLGSDSHHPPPNKPLAGQKYPGSHFTWVKMGEVSLEGLRLALLDGPSSVQRSDQSAGDPNAHAAMVLECIEIEQARYMGQGALLRIPFNPWLNTIIGGRGTGKSTIVEFLRLALRREQEIPQTLSEDLQKYSQVSHSREADGLLTERTQLSVVYRKNGGRFRLQWHQSGQVEPILAIAEDGSESPGDGAISERFPVQIFSQKQIYQLAKTPDALLQIIDQAPEIGRRAWDEQWQRESAQFLSLRAKTRALEVSPSERARLRGELDDVERKLALFEASGHAEVLQTYQARLRQLRQVEAWRESWQDVGEQIQAVARQVIPDPLDEARFSRTHPEEAALSDAAQQTQGRLTALRDRLQALAREAEQLRTDWISHVQASPWRAQVDSATAAYQALKNQLDAGGAGDPMAYGPLVQQRQLLEEQLKNLTAQRERAAQVQAQAQQSLRRLQELRQELTASRERFLQSTLAGNDYVRIEVVPYGAKDTAEAQFRALIGREGSGFERDIGTPEGGGLLGELYQNGAPQPHAADSRGCTEEREERLAALKRTLRAIVTDGPTAYTVRDHRFATALKQRPPETLDRLDLWFPEDALDVQYSPSGDGKNFRSIQRGSPGQKTAALLAFLLSYGEEPLILDQPEDDLDNHLIYQLIVAQLRSVKKRRQLIIVTHNPNIVVNGDAEQVIALDVHKGQTRIENAGSLQNREVRQTICTVMEGGREAFESRYRRIVWED